MVAVAVVHVVILNQMMVAMMSNMYCRYSMIPTSDLMRNVIDFSNIVVDLLYY